MFSEGAGDDEGGFEDKVEDGGYVVGFTCPQEISEEKVFA
jgi:hypothetical protein